IGMGKEFYDTMPECKEVFDLASEASGLDVPSLCFEENDKLDVTEYTQICMLTTEVAIAQALISRGIKADVTAGLSLGEYGALVISGTMSMKDAFSVVRKRGIYMQEAYPVGGGMSAVLALDADKIAEICEAVASETGKVVSIANYNCPGQIVITGEADAVNEAGQKCQEAGAKRVVPLKVSGPFHSALLKGAGEKLSEALAGVELHPIEVPYLTNVTGDYVKDQSEVKDFLTRQVSSSVRWQQSVERMIKDGADEFVEIGPGRSLSGFMRKINRDVATYNIDKMEDFEKYVDR
ncbi:MAG: ACP S-malonyltransferase, partial [Bacteroidales bacterium]|nr:ACP S-malonyltransferase [Bacteroidales bacterium]